MRLVLTMNTFEWDRKLYTQRDGTSIGTRAAPTFAGLFVGGLEANALQAWAELDPATLPEDWWRFIDDILFWWTGSSDDLRAFIKFMNEFHPAIKFTCEFDFATRSVEFLDMRIWVDEDGVIQTDLFVKKNAKNQYLLPSSNHPSHICKNIPYSLAYRIKRICSQPEQCEVRFGELRQLLLERGYRRRVVDSALDRVRLLDREVMLEKVVKVDQGMQDRVRAVFRFDRRLPDLSGIFRKNWQVMVEDDKRLLEVFPKPPMICYTRPKNVKDMLCQARLPPPRTNMRTRMQEEDGFKKCSKGCKLCSFTGVGTNGGKIVKSVRISNSGETCLKCDRTAPDVANYGGETGQQAVKRFAEHYATATQPCHVNTNTPVGRHFRLPGHTIADCVFIPVEKINSNDVFIRKARERRMISSLSLISHGLNKKL